jgi:hypothetical protein
VNVNYIYIARALQAGCQGGNLGRLWGLGRLGA